jgi:nucleoside-diphosphate-sugar epimerase
MRILISGICGFVGSTLARRLVEAGRGYQVSGFDNFIRPGSETNRAELKRLGVRLFHGDLRVASDLETLPAVDWVIDAAANPSVLAGIDGRTSSRQLIEHNLSGTVNLLEFCKQHRAGFILLSTSRVYAIEPLAALPVEVADRAFRPAAGAKLPPGVSPAGVDETFSTLAPISLYGATKLASEALAFEYGATFNFPVFVNRCGVLAGAGQFGRADQGIFAYWINAWLRRRPLIVHRLRRQWTSGTRLPASARSCAGAGTSVCRAASRDRGSRGQLLRRGRRGDVVAAIVGLVRWKVRCSRSQGAAGATPVRYSLDGARFGASHAPLAVATGDVDRSRS